jgi:hypothetical protein
MKEGRMKKYLPQTFLVLGLLGGLLFSGILNSAQGATTSDKRIQVLETKVKQLSNLINLTGSVMLGKFEGIQTQFDGLANATNPANAHTARITFLTERVSCESPASNIPTNIGNPYRACVITVIVP